MTIPLRGPHSPDPGLPLCPSLPCLLHGVSQYPPWLIPLHLALPDFLFHNPMLWECLVHTVRG